MKPKAILRHHSNSFPFDERTLDLSDPVKVGRAVAKVKAHCDNAIFDCKVLSRSHAMIWFHDGRFYIKDLGSSNGTFINNNRLSPANENSSQAELHSNDIIQFGVEVVDGGTKMTHGCIILKIKLLYPNGSEASKPAISFNIPTANMLPPYYSYTQMIEREQQVFERLTAIEEVLEESHMLADYALLANKEKQKLEKQLYDLALSYTQETKTVESLEEKIKEQTLQLNDNSKMIIAYKEDIEKLRKQLDSKSHQHHILVRTLFLLVIIISIFACFDQIVTFIYDSTSWTYPSK